ncbi:aspartate--ammonia ligase [Mycoplasmopsis fermentans]|nr:amino acid--tRNA ligase-related protein [Mycoplasmopsis fermentans]VEU67721.1 Aspartate--ammonia ligase [Mesomycoplasma conjunctivae]ADV34229.1 Aspartate--ammonia ligase [Mycoplasmopsis fermentans M64]RMX36047.1 aspartate-ammonia ligase family protein [Mycoplasmopsis fermentans MF-I2]RMX36117.1 aspartate-ammonia ligase family protein [Mycoplasmopsis fermentans MF-I1]VEU60255.1 Aspartate--ammonia ligase [Mycoplasmopsis fermentans]
MYKSKLNIKETQLAIQDLKFAFTKKLNKELHLTRVSAPLFVARNTKINDGLNGEEPVSFVPKNFDETVEIVHSLAKWKRYALKKYNFSTYEGIWTDMNAIRKEEDLDYLHSFYVDQWDWELIIKKEDCNLEFLKKIVNTIFKCIRHVEYKLLVEFPQLSQKLPENVTFISSSELYNLYPKLSPEERETKFAKKHKAIFIYEIGYPLADNKPQSKRAFDYDDWKLNGDLIVYDAVNKRALEISSMGIRVDKDSLLKQAEFSHVSQDEFKDYHKNIINNTFPLTIGGGIGQSRLSMFLLEKKHIGEVQVGIWPKKLIDDLAKEGVQLL